MLNVKIDIHPFELDNALTRLHYWSNQYDWGHHGPDIIVELNVVSDHHGHAEKLDGDRFAYPETKPMTSMDLLNQLRKNNPTQFQTGSEDDVKESLKLMDFIKTKRGGASRA